MQSINVFVSSTCYDLSQIRRDLFDAISQLGHNPVMSEFNTFPVDPLHSTVANCIKQVETSADIFVLIIGGRYGNTSPSGKSITNLEYSTAKRKNIPIYIFLKQDILNLIPLYEKNQDADFSPFVDSVKIFDFIKQLQRDSKWHYPFSSFQDIIQALRNQFSFHFKECLWTHINLHQQGDNTLLKKLSGQALKISLEKRTDLWKGHFWSQILVDEINKYENLKSDFENQFSFTGIIYVNSSHDFIKFMLEKQHYDKRISESIGTLLNDVLKKYLNSDESVAYKEGMLYAAETYGKIFKGITENSLRIMSLVCRTEQEHIKELALKLISPLIKKLWDYPFELQRKIEYAIEQISFGERIDKVDGMLTLPWDDEIEQEFTQAVKAYEIFIISQDR